eukprot:sb/3473329/
MADIEVEELEVEDLELEDFSCEVGDSDNDEAATEEVDICGMCGQVIEGQFLTALDNKFHPDCFCCVNCKTKIEPGQDFYERNDKPLCVGCYYELYGYKCKICSEYIKGQRLIWGDDAFHFQCVKCTGCSKALCETDDLKVVNKKDFIHVSCC